MKQANLFSIISAFKNLSPELFKSYLDYHSIKIKLDELMDLEVLLSDFKSIGKDMSLFDNYFVGYSIPQIGKEFDLLRIDNETVVNIELKKKSTEDNIKKQLFKNRYYLGFLKKTIYYFTYVSEDKKLYTIDSRENLVEVRLNSLIAILSKQNIEKIKDIDSYFNPADYLVSPFNSTTDFINGKYFLTKQQDEIKNCILRELDSLEYSILSIKGKAGTGKTLLTYDIAKYVSESEEVLIVHCGNLNRGQYSLRARYGLNIVPIKDLILQDLSKFHLIIIDEAQRIYPYQLEHIFREVKRIGNNCIFSYDGRQTLKKEEITNNIEDKIENELTCKVYKLTTTIRTNKEVDSFIQCLFNQKTPPEKKVYNNIELNYFDSRIEGKKFLSELKSNNWKVINYTPTKTKLPYDDYKIEDEDDDTHKVIGQEFNNVAAVIDSHFYYKDGVLSTRNYRTQPYYHPTKMLYQIVSRARIKLSIVIINNPEILKRCLEILNQ